jgi:hypothetical protein
MTVAERARVCDAKKPARMKASAAPARSATAAHRGEREEAHGSTAAKLFDEPHREGQSARPGDASWAGCFLTAPARWE